MAVCFGGEDTVPLKVDAAVGNVLAALDGLGEALAASVAAGETVDLPRRRRHLPKALENVLQIFVVEEAVNVFCRVAAAEIVDVQVLVKIDERRVPFGRRPH